MYQRHGKDVNSRNADSRVGQQNPQEVQDNTMNFKTETPPHFVTIWYFQLWIIE